MFLKEKASSHLVEVLSLNDLFDPFNAHVVGRYHHGEEVQDAEQFCKQALSFLSDEELPRCWLDPHYRDEEIQKRR